MDKIILVVYLDTPEELYDMHSKNNAELRHDNWPDIEFFFMHNSDKANTIECINPKLITKEEYAKVTDTIKSVNEYYKSIFHDK